MSGLGTTADQLWGSCADLLRQRVSDATWKTWFEAARPIALAGDQLLVAVPSSLVKERLEARYLDLVHTALADTGAAGVAVKFEVATDLAEHEYTGRAGDNAVDTLSAAAIESAVQIMGSSVESLSGPLNGESLPSSEPVMNGGLLGRTGSSREATAEPAGSAWHRAEEMPLNPRYSFEAFVTGTSNRFAHAAALAVAETPARSYNPLFIYGRAGLGKTHLLHAIGNYVRQNYPSLHVRYVSTETFMNEFVDAIRANATTAFKRRYRECDVLLVDDIQFMENKEGLQEEFFHTFNSLHGAGRQIVISSDRPPRSLATLEDRLRSRFEWGLTTDVQPPDIETRLAILRKKAEGERAHVPDEVLDYIGTHVKDNIRELEGALIRVSAFASLNGEPLTLAMAERVLGDLIGDREPRQITPKVILEATVSMFGFGTDELCGRSRSRPLVNARQISMYVFRELTDFSYPAIAREFGGRDHTTVIHAVEKIAGQMKERRVIYDQVTELLNLVRTGA